MSWEDTTPTRLKFLLGITSGKTDTLDKALEKTWIAHVVIAGIGIAMVLDIGKVTESVFLHLLGSYDHRTAAAILLAISLYYSMKTGPLLTAFNQARMLRDDLLDAYLAGQKGMVDPLRQPTSFLAAVFYDDEPGPGHAGGGSGWRWKLEEWVPKWVPYFVITTFVVSLAQAAPLFLVYEAYHASPRFWLVIVIVSAFLLALYYMLWKPPSSTATTASRSTRPWYKEIRDGDVEGVEPPGKAQSEQSRRSLAVRVLLVSVILWVALFTFLNWDNLTQDKDDQAQRPGGCCDLANAARPAPSH